MFKIDFKFALAVWLSCGAAATNSDALEKNAPTLLVSDQNVFPGGGRRDSAASSREGVEAACAYAAQIPPDRITDYTLRSGVFDINGDGSFETVRGTTAMGTMRGDAFEILDAAGQLVEWTEVDVEGGPDLLGARWLPFRGRAYLLGFEDERAGFLIRLSYPDAGHQLRIGCQFTTKVEERILPSADDAADVCRAVEEGGAEELKVVDLSDAVPKRRWTLIDGHIDVDLGNEGRPITLQRLSYSSSAGRGCDATYFDTMDHGRREAGDRAHRDLMDLQRIDADEQGNDYTPTECGGLIRRWLRVNGKTYLETRYPDETPRGDRQMVHRIQGMVDGKPRTVCQGAFHRSWLLVPDDR